MARRKPGWASCCEAVEENGLFFWQVAQEANIGQTTLCRWLREEPRPERKERVESAITSLLAKRPGFQA